MTDSDGEVLGTADGAGAEVGAFVYVAVGAIWCVLDHSSDPYFTACGVGVGVGVGDVAGLVVEVETEVEVAILPSADTEIDPGMLIDELPDDAPPHT